LWRAGAGTGTSEQPQGTGSQKSLLAWIDPFSWRRLSRGHALCGSLPGALRATEHRADRFAGAFRCKSSDWFSSHTTLDESCSRSPVLGAVGFGANEWWAGAQQHSQWPQGARARARDQERLGTNPQHARPHAWIAGRKSSDVALVYLDFYTQYETEAFLRGGDERQAREEVQRLGERLGPYRRYRLPYLQSLAVLAVWDGESEQAIGHFREAAGLAA